MSLGNTAGKDLNAPPDIQAPPRPFEVSNRSVLAIAIPMTLAYTTTPLLGIVDTAVVGRFADAALLGGLASGAIAFSVVFTTFNFLRSASTGLVAQAVGSENLREEQMVLLRFLLLAIVSGLLLQLSAPIIIRAGIYFMNPEPAVAMAMSVYLGIRFWSAPAALANYAILGYVLGRGEGALGLLLQAILNGTNIALSIYLGLVLGWGIEGVAWGTVGAEATASAIGLILVARRVPLSSLPELHELADLAALRRMNAINGDIMIRSFSLLAAFAVFTRQGAQLGTALLAANAVLINFFMLAGYVLDGFATAAEQLTGKALGARYLPAFNRVLKLTLVWGFAVAGLTSLVFQLFGPSFIAAMTASVETRAIAAQYLPWAAFTAISGVLAFQMDGVFIGATWSRDMRNMMLISLAAYLVVLPLLAMHFGNHGLWMALHIFLVIRGVSLLVLVPQRRRRYFPGA